MKTAHAWVGVITFVMFTICGITGVGRTMNKKVKHGIFALLGFGFILLQAILGFSMLP